MKYLDKQTFMHRLDPRTKIILALMVAVLIVVLRQPVQLFGLTGAVLALYLLMRPGKAKIRIMATIMLSVLFFTMVSQGFFYTREPRTVIFTLLSPETGMIGRVTGGIVFYREGAIYGALQSLRLFSAMLLSALIVMSTYPSDLLLGMERMGMPQRFAFVVMVSIRFIPTLAEEARRILLAQRLRGMKIQGIRGWFRAFVHLLPPLIIDSLRNARRIALAAEVRAFTGRRTSVKELHFSTRDWSVLGFSFSAMVLLMLI